MKKKVLFYSKYISKLKKLVEEDGQSDALHVEDVDEEGGEYREWMLHIHRANEFNEN